MIGRRCGAVVVALLVASVARADPPCVEHADRSVTCTADGARALQIEILDLRKAVALAHADTEHVTEVARADADLARKDLAASIARVAALEAVQCPPAPNPWPLVGLGAGGAAVVIVAIVVAVRR